MKAQLWHSKSVPDDVVAATVRDYMRLGSISAVAQQSLLGSPRIQRILLEAGVLKQKGWQPLPISNEEIAKLYLSGMDCTQIAEKLMPERCQKRAKEVVRRRLEKQGIPRRKRMNPVGEDSPFYKPKKQGDIVHYCRRMSYEVAAICLGVPLPPGVLIHHQDENPYNNNPENLVVFPTQRNHARFHQQQLGLQRKGLPIDATRLALENDGLLLQRPASLNGCELCISPADLSTKDLRGGRGRTKWRLPDSIVQQ